MRPAVRATTVAWVIGAAAGCGADGPYPLEWRFRFESEAQRASSVAIHARILRDGCDGRVAQYDRTFDLAAGGGAMSPPRLPEGTWGFEVRARDAACRATGAGCVTLELPDPDRARIEVLLAATGAAGADCPDAECHEGACDPVDGGPPPAPDGAPPPGTDGGPPDGGSIFWACTGPERADCDRDPRNGCEAPCPAGPNVETGCTFDGTCAGRCAPGFSDCDGRIATGCEVEGSCTCAGDDCTLTCRLGCDVTCEADCRITCPEGCARCNLDCPMGHCTATCEYGDVEITGGTAGCAILGCF